MTCLDAGSGAQLGQFKAATPAVTGPASRPPGPRACVAVANGRVGTLGVTGLLRCLDAATGQLLWSKDPFPGVTPRFYTAASPLIVKNVVIGYQGGPGNGALIAYDLATGEKWRWRGEGPDYASPVLMNVGNTPQIVTLTEKSIVGVALADGRLLWQRPFVPQGRAYHTATPVVDVDIAYYMGSQRGAFAVRIERQGETFVAIELWANPEVACQFCTPVLKDGYLYGLSDRRLSKFVWRPRQGASPGRIPM